MKKTIAMILAAILSVFCLASCGGEYSDVNNAYDLYSNAQKAFEDGVDMKMTMTIDIAGQKVETVMDMKATETAYEIAMNMEGIEVNTTYVDGIMYMNMDLGALGTQKYKQELSIDEFIKEAGAEGSELPELTAEALKDIPVETKNGMKTFTVTLKSEDYTELLEEYAGDLGNGNYSDITITCNFDSKGVLSEYVMSFGIISDEETMGVEAKMEFNSIGKAPTITAPADAETYTEYSGGIFDGLLG